MLKMFIAVMQLLLLVFSYQLCNCYALSTAIKNRLRTKRFCLGHICHPPRTKSSVIYIKSYGTIMVIMTDLWIKSYEYCLWSNQLVYMEFFLFICFASKKALFMVLWSVYAFKIIRNIISWTVSLINIQNQNINRSWNHSKRNIQCLNWKFLWIFHLNHQFDYF